MPDLNNIRILFVYPQFLKEPDSKFTQHIQDLYSQIKQKINCTIDILCLSAPGCKKTDLQNSSPQQFNTIEIKHQPRLFTFDAVSSRKVAKDIDKLCTQNKYDILHIFSLGPLTAAPIEIAHKHDLKILMTVNDFWFICEENQNLVASTPYCNGPEKIDKCVKCFLRRYVSAAQREKFELPLREHKKSRLRYLKQSWQKIDYICTHEKQIKGKYAEFGWESIELLECSNKPYTGKIAEKYIQEYQNFIPYTLSKPQATDRKRILFYFFDKMHIPILRPIYLTMKAKYPGSKFCLAAMPKENGFNAGFRENELGLLRSWQEEATFYPYEFVPDCTILPDSYYPPSLGKLIHVGHGVLSKGIYYSKSNRAKEEEKADLICVPGLYHQSILQKFISKPIIATGMAKLDDLFKGKVNKKSVCKHYKLPEHFTYILYAPTYNQELSSLDYLLESIDQVLVNKQTILLIKLHSRSKSKYKAIAQKLVQKDKRIIFVTDQDITPFLALADLMISDVSSAMMEFAALDKPLILFNNPNWKEYDYFNPKDIDFAWRDIGLQIHDPSQLRDAVQECLNDPGQFSAKRNNYSELLFANKNTGQAAETISQLVQQLL